MEACTIFRRFSVILRQNIAMANFVSEVSHASDETIRPRVADPHSLDTMGVKLLQKVYKTVTKTNPLKLDLAEHKMASTVYFKGGMTLDQTKLGAEQFKSDYSELGSRRSQDELAVFKAMLKELPPALQEPPSTIVRDLLWEMEESSMNSEPLIAYYKLVTKMAIMLRNVQGAATKVKEVNSTGAL